MMNTHFLSSRLVLSRLYPSALKMTSSTLPSARSFSAKQSLQPSAIEITTQEQISKSQKSPHNIIHRLKLKRAKKEKNPESHFNSATLELPNVRVKVYDKRTDRDEPRLPFQQKPVPHSAKFYPYTIKKPMMYPKTYFWCSCGMSMKQPFCDNSHSGSSFKPIKFGLDQHVEQIHLCGCKMSINAPYCDGQTCAGLREGTSAEQIHAQEELIEQEEKEKNEIPSIRQQLLELTGQKEEPEQKFIYYDEETKPKQLEAEIIEETQETELEIKEEGKEGETKEEGKQ